MSIRNVLSIVSQAAFISRLVAILHRIHKDNVCIDYMYVAMPWSKFCCTGENKRILVVFSQSWTRTRFFSLPVSGESYSQVKETTPELLLCRLFVWSKVPLYGFIQHFAHRLVMPVRTVSTAMGKVVGFVITCVNAVSCHSPHLICLVCQGFWRRSNLQKEDSFDKCILQC